MQMVIRITNWRLSGLTTKSHPEAEAEVRGAISGAHIMAGLTLDPGNPSMNQGKHVGNRGKEKVGIRSV